jgi:hypothetical protein
MVDGFVSFPQPGSTTVAVARGGVRDGSGAGGRKILEACVTGRRRRPNIGDDEGICVGG